MPNLGYRCHVCGDGDCPGCPTDADLAYDELAAMDEHQGKEPEDIWAMVGQKLREIEEGKAETLAQQ